MIPAFQLYGEQTAFPDILHVERIRDRAAGLDWIIAPHRHLHLHQLFLLTSGQVQMSLEGERYRIAPPTVVNVPRGAVHGFAFSAGTEGFVLTLPADTMPELFGAMAETAVPLARLFLLAATSEMARRFETLSAAHAASGPFRRSFLRAEAAALLSLVLENAQPIAAHRTSTDPRIAAFIALVRATLTSQRRVDDFARDLALSPRHLSRLCKSETGLSAQAFVEAQKMREACRLLVYTRMSVQQVAFQLGYDDPSYFSRVFQRNLGLSPRHYRARFDS